MIRIIKKSILSILLAVIFIFGAGEGMINAFAEAVDEQDTPIAKIENDDYIPYNYANNEKENDVINSITKEVESVGGYVETYSSEEEYEKAQTEKVQSASVETYQKTETVKQVITVMTTATGSKKNGNYVESKPIANAIVRIDGTPRFTDRKGQVKVTLEKEGYVELIIEKDGYNPYIEIMDVTGEEKVVHLKQPSDDIDIYAVMLNHAGSEFNVLLQPSYIDEDIDNSYYSELTVLCNVPAEAYYLLRNGKIFRYSSVATFYDIKFDTLVPGDKISVQVEYSGIRSQPIDTLITIEKLADASFDDVTIKDEDKNQGNLSLGLEDSTGMFGGFNINLLDFLKGRDQLTEFLQEEHRHSVNLGVNYDNRTGILSVTVGYSYDRYFDKTKTGEDGLTDLGRYEMATALIDENNKQEQATNKKIDDLSNELNKNEERLKTLTESNKNDRKTIEKLESEIRANKREIDKIQENKEKDAGYYRKQQNKKREELEKVQKSVRERNKVVNDLVNQINNNQISLNDFNQKLSTIKDFAKSTKKLYNQFQRGITFQFEALGLFNYNVKENIIEKISLTGSVSVGYKWSGTFMLWVFPCFYEVNASLKLSVSLVFVEEEMGVMLPTFDEVFKRILIELSLTLRGEIGVGFNDVASISAFAQAIGGVSVYPLAKDEDGDIYLLDIENNNNNPFNKYGTMADLKIGVRAEFLFYDVEYGIGKYFENKPTIPIFDNNSSSDSSGYSLMKRSKKIVSNEASQLSNNEISSVYQGSKPQIVQLNSSNILIWLADEPTRNTYNRTVLKYAIYTDGNWGEAYSVYDDGKADFYFDTYCDGKDFYVTWQKTNRILSEEDDYISTGSASEIYIAKFDFLTQKFGEPVRLTNDTELDAAPKFAIKENKNDPLTVVWQKNSDNDILGISGKNSIYYSKFKLGGWEEPKKLYETDQYISFITSAVRNGVVTSAFEEEVDGDLITQDRITKIAFEDRDALPFEDGLFNPQFVSFDNKITLFNYSDGHIVFTQDFLHSYIFTELDNASIPDNFKVTNTDTGLLLSYTKVEQDKNIAYCAYFTSGEWYYNIKLAEEDLTILNVRCLNCTDGKILSVYNLSDDDGNTAMRISEKHLKSDFEIESAFFDVLASNGEAVKLNINVKNTGDYDLKDFVVNINEQIVNISLEAPIVSGNNGYLIIDLVYYTDNLVNITVSANGINRFYELDTHYVDLQLFGDIKVENGQQTFNLTIANNGNVSSEIIFEAYKKGEVVYSEPIYVEANSDVTRKLNIKDLVKDEIVYFKIVSVEEDRFLSDNSVLIRSILDDFAMTDYIINPYEQGLQGAKNIMEH